MLTKDITSYFKFEERPKEIQTTIAWIDKVELRKEGESYKLIIYGGTNSDNVHYKVFARDTAILVMGNYSLGSIVNLKINENYLKGELVRDIRPYPTSPNENNFAGFTYTFTIPKEMIHLPCSLHYSYTSDPKGDTVRRHYSDTAMDFYVYSYSYNKEWTRCYFGIKKVEGDTWLDLSQFINTPPSIEILSPRQGDTMNTLAHSYQVKLFDADDDAMEVYIQVSNNDTFTDLDYNYSIIRTYRNGQHIVTPTTPLKTSGIKYLRMRVREVSGTWGDWTPVVQFKANTLPQLLDATENNKIFYEGDTIVINGSATDLDSGNIISVKYKVNDRPARAIATGISDGSTPISYSRMLSYTLGMLKDGGAIVASGLADGQTYKITIWAEDDQGGKSAEIVRNFTIVRNRAPVLSMTPITPQNNKINSEKITISGTVTDADGNDVTVDLKVNNNASVQIYSGVPSDFSHDIKIADLKEGENTITVVSKDTFDFVTTKVIKLNKARNAVPLKKAIARYKVNPPTGSAKEILAWVQKEVGDLTIDADVSMVLQGESEQYVAMNKLTAPINDNLEEDEFTYQALEEKDNITLKLKLSKENTESKQSIKQISGVLG